jgi:thiol-disulfide isomerase/thioredoxin
MISKGVIIGIVAVILLILIGFTFFGGDNSADQAPSDSNTILPSNDNSQVIINPTKDSQPLWYTHEFKDINTQESYSIQSLNDKPILLEAFAVWCPTCTKQQNEIKEIHEEIGDEVISISLDTDQGEDEAFILEHTQSHGFDWRYSISPLEVTTSLKDSFGLGIINPPQAPVVLICQDGSFRLLDRGVKKVDDLKKEIATCN